MKQILFFVLLIAFIDSNSQTVKKVSISELEQYISTSKRPLVVNFYATWCSPCLHELPYFQQTVGTFASQNVELVLVSMDYAGRPIKKVEEFAVKNHLTGTLFWLDESNADVFCPRIDKKWEGGIPATLFFNKATGYRKFFERQLTAPQFKQEVKLLVHQ